MSDGMDKTLEQRIEELEQLGSSQAFLIAELQREMDDVRAQIALAIGRAGGPPFSVSYEPEAQIAKDLADYLQPVAVDEASHADE